MEAIEHRVVEVSGINMHVAELGPSNGPVILFIHGFPGLWYSWRHQIVALASLGYRAVAPDLRGYGDTDAPADHRSYTVLHVIGDLIGLIDVVADHQEKVFVVGHDWGAYMAWYLCVFRPDRVKALVNLSVSFHRRNPERKIMDTMRAMFGDDYYMCRIQELGNVDAEFAALGWGRVMEEFLTCHHPGSLFLPKGKSPENAIVLPSWLSDDDVKYYSTKFHTRGFTGALNYYRNLDLSWELLAPWTGAQVKVPTKFIVGDQDPTYISLGYKDYLENGELKKDVPLLQEVIIMEGVAHFLNQEKPDEINEHIADFIQKF